MKQPTRLAILLLALTILLLAPPALADDADSAKQQAMMEAMQKAMAPGENHEFLAGQAGDWTYTGKMWMDPNQPPAETTGTLKSAMILDGRYLEEQISGEVMGSTFSGRGTTAYDNTTGEFIYTWIDSMGTGILVSRGQRDGNTLTVKGKFVDPMSKQPLKVRAVTHVVDKDHYTYEYYSTAPGAPEFKSLELECVRKGK